MKAKLFISLFCMFIFVSLKAQPPQHGHKGPEIPSPQELAKEMTDIMQMDIKLSDKQYKSVYNLLLKDFKFVKKVRTQISQGGMPPKDGGQGGANRISFGGDNGQMGLSANSRGANLDGSVNLGQGASVNGSIGAGSGGVGLKGGITIGGSHGGGNSMGGHGAMQNGGGHGGDRMPHKDGMGPEQIPIPDEYLQKEDQKLKKILTAKQYRMWREKHPLDYLSYLYKSKNKRRPKM